MLRNFFVYKIQCELSCPKLSEKFQGFPGKNSAQDPDKILYKIL